MTGPQRRVTIQVTVAETPNAGGHYPDWTDIASTTITASAEMIDPETTARAVATAIQRFLDLPMTEQYARMRWHRDPIVPGPIVDAPDAPTPVAAAPSDVADYELPF